MTEEKALKFIKYSVRAGIISLIFWLLGSMTIIGMGISKNSHELIELIIIILPMIIAPTITFGLTWGIIKKKSRVCTIILFIFSLYFAIYAIVNKSIFMLFIACIFLIIYFNGIRGTIYYHKKIKNNDKLSY